MFSHVRGNFDTIAKVRCAAASVLIGATAVARTQYFVTFSKVHEFYGGLVLLLPEGEPVRRTHTQRTAGDTI
jgi:hypothetical protein